MEEEKKYSILIADDDGLNTEALKQILSSDYTIYTVNSGEKALEVAEKVSPDIILLDIVMPERDGYSVLAALKNTKKTQNIPVIFITGLVSDDEEEKGLDLGAVDYITKPFSLTNVRLRVKKQIDILEQLRAVERLSLIDQLTDLPNRRSFEARLNTEWARALREKTSISILFIDADKFKNYNDAYGHQQGDVALQTLAKIFTETLKRPGDFTARWGGEEFIILLPNTDYHGSIEVAEHIRQNVEETKIPCTDGQGERITVSIGINTLGHKRDDTLENFILGSDMALYTAKEKGRNNVYHIHDDPKTPS